jgi:hypothetical protein
MNNIYDIQVADRKSFIQFLQLLQKDFEQNKADWENQDLGSFLEAMTQYAEDIEGYYQNLTRQTGEKISPNEPTWRVFADILRGAKVYE